MTPRALARLIEMAVHGTKSAYPSMLPADAFLKDLEVMLRTLVAGAVVPPMKRACGKIPPQRGEPEMSTMTINGQSRPLPDDADALLVDVIRDQLALTGTKLVCGSGVCGACTVLLDGAPVASCLLPAQAAAGKTLTTVEGIGGDKAASDPEGLHGARCAAVRILHTRVHRGSRRVSRLLARGQARGDAVARGNRRRTVGTSLPLRRL